MNTRSLLAGAVIAVAGLGFCGTLNVSAADTTRPAAEARSQAPLPEMPGARLERLHKILGDLDLTAEQKAKIHEIVEPYRKSLEEWRDSHKADIEKVRDELKAAREAKDRDKVKAAIEDLKNLIETAPKIRDVLEQVKAVLTPRQLDKVKHRLEELRERIEERREHRDGDAPPQ